MHRKPRKPSTRPALFTTLALLAVVGFSAAPALADRGGYPHSDRGRAHVYHAPPPPVCYPAPRVVVVRQPAYRLIPAHYEIRTQTVCVEPARVERRWVEPTFGVRYDSRGNHVRVALESGHWVHYTIPARYETRTVQVFIPDQYVPVAHAPTPGIVVAPRYPHGHDRY